jgi:hypothetical protein
LKNSLIITIVLVVAIGAGAFYGGMLYGQQSRRSAFAGQFGGAGGFGGTQRTGGGRAGGSRPVNGDIIASDSNSITVKLADGSSKIVIVSDTTSINKASQATKADLITGQKVMVFGQANSDGSITAQSIQLNPMQRLGGNSNQNPENQKPTPQQ